MKIKGLRSFCGVVCYGAILPEHLVIHVSTGVFAANYIELVFMCRLVVMYELFWKMSLHVNAE